MHYIQRENHRAVSGDPEEKSISVGVKLLKVHFWRHQRWHSPTFNELSSAYGFKSMWIDSNHSESNN